MDHDPVHHPQHYCRGNIEVIDFIIDQGLDYCEGNAVKYICRHRMKGGVTDIRKAIKYLQFIEQCYDQLYGGENGKDTGISGTGKPQINPNKSTPPERKLSSAHEDS